MPTDLPPTPAPYTLGINWLVQFKRRHPEVATVWSRAINSSRLDGCAESKLDPYLTQVKALYDQHHYPPSHIFNMDKTGFAIGKTKSHQVMVVEGGRGKAFKASPGRQEWITSIECITAAGGVLPPLVIFKAIGAFNARWRPADCPLIADWVWRTSAKGWTNHYLALEWLDHVFLPHIITQCPGQRLLIVDGHGSHVQADFIARCINHSTNLVVLPLHSSHHTQPLNILIFGPLKTHLSASTNRFMQYNKGHIQKVDWIRLMAEACAAAMTERNVRAGWKATGDWPCSMERLVQGPLLTAPVTPP
jgi:hypothetical protein